MIEVSSLSKRYGTHLAVKDVNFSIQKGEVIGFLGPNGAGKSTIMNILTGYLSLTQGKVEIDGFNIMEYPEEAKKRIGYLPEIPPLYIDIHYTIISIIRKNAIENKKNNPNMNSSSSRI